jgi:hypothetical protein
MLQTTKSKRHYKAGKPNKQLPHLDGRTKASRRFRLICSQLTSDLGHEPSVAEAALIRQAAAVIVASEQIQGRVLSGVAGVAEIKEGTRLGNLAARCLIALGLQRKGSTRHALSRQLSPRQDEREAMTLDLDAREAGDVSLDAAEAPRPLSPCRPVALRGQMGRDGYVPENGAWFDHLTKPDDETGRTRSDGRSRRVGRDPMAVPLDILTAAGHPPRRTSRLVAALSGALDLDLSGYAMREYRDLRRCCLDCAQNSAGVRRCAIINCPLWPFRMGKNPHHPKRGTNPFAERSP